MDKNFLMTPPEDGAKHRDEQKKTAESNNPLPELKNASKRLAGDEGERAEERRAEHGDPEAEKQ